MRVLIVNSVCGIGSTGRICTEIAREYEAVGHTVCIAYGRGTVPEDAQKYVYRIGGKPDFAAHVLKTRLLDGHGLGSRAATRRFLSWAEEYRPELLWLHNIHGYYLNYELLFDWIKRHPEMEVRWTLHDCWAFTGHCAYFTMAGCEKWKQDCASCPQKGSYPASLLYDGAAENLRRKRAAFCGVKNMTLIVPSHWLAGLVGESFLRQYPVEVRHNTIDTALFRPTESHFRQEHGLERKRIVLGVSNAWQEPRKGLKDMLALASLLGSEFAVVIVGLPDELRKVMPKNVTALGKSGSPEELAGIYTAADVFVNPTYEDNYPSTNLEAQACGTRVVSYDTGGCRETLHRSDSVLVPTGDLEALAEECRR